MKIQNGMEGYPDNAKGTAVALGFFDGLHTGHMAVLSAAKSYAESHGLDFAVFTFVFKGKGGAQKGKLLLSPGQKHELLENMGVQYCFEPPFESFRTLSPEIFFHELLVGKYKAKALFCGEDFAFGAHRAGNIQTLRELCEKNSVELAVAPLAEYKGQVVSASRIRAALAGGDIKAANEMLGRPFEIDLPVRHGENLGTKLGFPTINQILPGWLQAPAYGVYITETLLGGAALPSVTGYGTRPTVDDGKEPTCETFLPGYSGNLYGKDVRVRFLKRIADIEKFPGAEALARAVQKWAQQALDYFADNGET